MADPRDEADDILEGDAEDVEERLGRLKTLAEQAKRGDRGAVPALRKVFDAIPGLWQWHGDLATQVEEAWMAAFIKQDEHLRECVSRRLKQLRREVGGPTPGPLERLLVERVAACWLVLHLSELAYAQKMRDGVPWEASHHWQKMLDRLQRRYLAAIRTLALVRRLEVPVVLEQPPALPAVSPAGLPKGVGDIVPSAAGWPTR